jgi:nucleoside-diphosphate-sugar epimerase
MKKIIVTGGSGKAGRAVVSDLLEHGYDVLNIDIAAPRTPTSIFLRADLTDIGQTFDSFRGYDAVVHLAAIPAPGLFSDEVTWRTNTTATFNVFHAATALGFKRIVHASSETTLGLPFDREKPHYAPIDEQHPLYPQSTYALSKLLGEKMAVEYSRWSGIPIVGLRISNIMEPHDYARFESYQDDPRIRKWNLWGYVDARDVAQACRLGLTANVSGAPNYIIAAADTCMRRPNSELMNSIFPGVPLRTKEPHATLLSIEKARAELGYSPKYSWRDSMTI